jgi:hypothetical protein
LQMSAVFVSIVLTGPTGPEYGEEPA